MTLEDPFFIVKEEVVKSVTKTRGLYQRWSELQEDQTAVGKEELEWTTTELRNSLRSIEWDLEDLEETVGIVEKNPRKFKIDDEEIKKRRSFLVETKEEVKTMRENLLENKMKEKRFRQVQNVPSGPGTTKYIRLLNELESPEHQFVLPPPLGQKHSTMVDTDGSSNLTRPLGNEADEQAVMLDGTEQETNIVDPQMKVGVNKITRVLHLTTDKRQWLAIGVLSGMMVVVVTLIVLL